MAEQIPQFDADVAQWLRALSSTSEADPPTTVAARHVKQVLAFVSACARRARNVAKAAAGSVGPATAPPASAWPEVVEALHQLTDSPMATSVPSLKQQARSLQNSLQAAAGPAAATGKLSAAEPTPTPAPTAKAAAASQPTKRARSGQ